MNTLRLLVDFPPGLALAKWTALLAAAWLAQPLLRRQSARARRFVWRGLLVGGLVLVLVLVLGCFVPLPGFRVHLPAARPSPPTLPQPIATPAVDGLSATPKGGLDAPLSLPASPSSQRSGNMGRSSVFQRVTALPWPMVFGTIWGLGVVVGAVRLLLCHRRLRCLTFGATEASPRFGAVAAEIMAAWGADCLPAIRVSPGISSPFVCGILRPCLLLPRAFESTLTPEQHRALLGHELAHVHGHDLIWGAAWRWMATLCWFHPLVWFVPAAHALECELEADRRSASLMASSEEYSRSLAQLALRVLRLPPLENPLALHGASHLARRLRYLDHPPASTWNRPRRVATFASVVGLIAASAGCEPVHDATPPDSASFQLAEVRVVNEQGQPIEGALVEPFGLRVASETASAHGWRTDRWGPRPAVSTDAAGRAGIRYPAMAFPEERERTALLLLTVRHPRYAKAVSQGYPVDGKPAPIRLRLGAGLRVTGYFGADQTPVSPLVANLGGDEEITPDAWEKHADGSISCGQLAPGPRLLQLSGRLPSGDIVHGETISVTTESGTVRTQSVELLPGIRLEGRLDSRVPRPIRNGRVLVAVRPREFPATANPEELGDRYAKHGYFRFWHTFRPIAEDGTFVFESLPPGEVDILCHGDGFVSANGDTPRNRMPDGAIQPGLRIGVPQAFPLQRPVTRVEVVSEPTCDVTVRLINRSGQPVAGARIGASPNMMRIPGGIFGEADGSSEATLRRLEPLPELPYWGTTDATGVFVIRNLPACTRGLDVEHPGYVVPVDPTHHDRWVRFSLTPGQDLTMDVNLVPRGTDFTGPGR